MHRIGILLAVVALALFASDVYSFPGGKGKAKGKSAQGQGGGKGVGKGGQAGKGGQGGKGGQAGKGGPPSPAAMAARMIQNFDRDGDKALNEQELTAAFTALRQMRAQRGKGGAGKGNFGGKGGAGKGKGKGQGGGGKSKKGQQ